MGLFGAVPRSLPAGHRCDGRATHRRAQQPAIEALLLWAKHVHDGAVQERLFRGALPASLPFALQGPPTAEG